MARKLTAQSVAERVLRDGEPMKGILADLAVDRELTIAILRELLKHRRVEVRSWVPYAAAQVLGKAGIPLILAAARDRDGDVKDSAVQHLRDIDLEAVRVLIPSLRRQVRSREFHEPVFAMWTLAELDDVGALDEIRKVVAAPAEPYHAKVAEIVALYLTGDLATILGRIKNHDHLPMPWLAHAAALAATPDTIAALDVGARELPDDECRYYCREAVADAHRRLARRAPPRLPTTD